MCLGIAQKWEVRTFEESQNKDQYVERMEQKLNEIRQRRSQQAGNISLGANGMMPGNQMPNNGMMRPGNMMPGVSNMGNMVNMQNMGNMNGPNGMNGMGFPNNQMNGQNAMFPAQLARPMQPSPVNMPGQGGTMDPSALQMSRQQSQQQQQQTQQQQQQQQQNAMNQTGQQQAANLAQGGQAQAGQNLQVKLQQHARVIFDSMSDEQKNGIRSRLLSSMNPQQRQMMQQSGRDPLMQFCLKKAQEAFAKGQRTQQMPGQQNPGNMQMQMGNNVPQRPPSQAGGQNFDVSGILGQQANALKLQDAGEQVVPASNNNTNNFNMGLGNNQMNQSINPQMLNNQGTSSAQSGNNAISQQQAVFFNQQRNAQQQERLQKQVMAQAQQHAMQAARMQANQLTGQPGGLHAGNSFSGAAAPSPAMNMLNRPMVPQGQVTPGTPQPNRQQPMPQTPMNGANQLMQHHQNMVNQNNQLHNQQNQQMMPQQALQAMLNRVPQEYRARLLQMPPDQMQMMLAKMANVNKLQNGPVQPGQMHQQGMSLPGGQPTPNMLQQMGNANTGFNSQPQVNQPGMQMNAQALAQRHQQAQMARLKQNIMDSKPFPRNVLQGLSISVPPHVQKWAELKAHITQNASVMPPHTQERLQQMQIQWFQQHPQEVNTTMQAIVQQKRAHEQAQNGQQSLMGNNMPQQGLPANPQAPPAQMVPPVPVMVPPQANVAPGGAQVQQQAVLAIMGQITAEDMQRWRMTVGPKGQQLSDAQVRQFMAGQRLQRMQQMQQGQRPPSQTPQIPRPQPANMPNGTQAQQRIPQPGQHQAAAGQKPPQPANDDVIEIANPAITQQPPQAPPMQASNNSQQRLPTQAQVAQMTEEQKAAWLQKRRQLEALRQAQAAGNSGMGMPAPGAAMQQNVNQKLQNMMREVHETTQKGQRVNLDAEGHERVREKLSRLWNPVMQMTRTFLSAMGWGMEQQLRGIIRTMCIVKLNAKDDKGTPNGYYAVTQQQLQEMERSVATYMSDFKNMQLRMQVQKGAANSGQQPAAPTVVQATPSQQGHTRKPSNIKAPPAPTDEKKFDWAAQSPGVPKYADEQPVLTRDGLKLPPQKKRKPNQTPSQVTTPAAPPGGTPVPAGASPAIGSGKTQQSPEQVRRNAEQAKAAADREAELKKFRCKDIACEHSLRGFDTEAQLNEHDMAEHQEPENALEFFLNSATKALEVDDQGNPIAKADVPDAKATPATAAPPAKPRLTVKDLQPDELTKQEAEQLKKNLVPTSVKQKLAKKQADADMRSGKDKEVEKEQTMRDAISQKLNIPISAAEPTMPGAEVQDEEMFDLGLGGYDADGFDLFGLESNQMSNDCFEDMVRMGPSAWEPVDGDLSAWRLVDDPELTDSSHENTPSDGSQSSHASDVSQSDTMRFMISCENDKWDPFGTGDCGIAQSMLPLYTQIKDMMADASSADGSLSPKKRKAVEDVWDAPVRDFLDNDFFGAQKQN